ncbi:hypothetical protein HQN90_09225 [Paenibacillus alba]|uniref:hypothetical protein n=1 Tax=Paenibacillus alba TaxID=1197127 RepID=UPI001565208A|nr:hypothetical protein [Paenibacillus alba]NQX66306.1 hypothetical protein [Paenibacillus alba]
MNVHWRKSAVLSLMSLDSWREKMELQPIASYLRNCIVQYFQKQDFTIYVPGSAVFIEGYPAGLRMALITIGTVDPYKVFYRYSQNAVEIFLVRHPRQRILQK